MAVYFARGLDSGLTKIGCAVDPIARVRLHATRFRESLELFAALPGGSEAEREWHERFAQFRALDAGRGREWFRDEGRIRRFVFETLPAECCGSFEVRTRTRGRPTRPLTDIGLTPEAIEAAYRAGYERAHGHAFAVATQHMATCRRCELEVLRTSFGRRGNPRPKGPPGFIARLWKPAAAAKTEAA